MNKKVSIGFAISIMIIIGGFFTGVFYVGGKFSTNETVNNVSKKEVSKVECKAHYYDGEGQINAWKVGDDERGGVIVQISSEDVKNLPVNNDRAMVVESNPKVDLVDPSEDVRNVLVDSSSEKPVVITVKGYAETCDSLIPSVSMDLATVMLKKS